MLTEEGLIKSQQQFEGHLTELREKAELLSSTLDQEADKRKRSEEEVTILTKHLEKTNEELQELICSTTQQEKMLNQQLEEVRREAALRERDLEASR